MISGSVAKIPGGDACCQTPQARALHTLHVYRTRASTVPTPLNFLPSEQPKIASGLANSEMAVELGLDNTMLKRNVLHYLVYFLMRHCHTLA